MAILDKLLMTGNSWTDYIFDNQARPQRLANGWFIALAYDRGGDYTFSVLISRDNFATMELLGKIPLESGSFEPDLTRFALTSNGTQFFVGISDYVQNEITFGVYTVADFENAPGNTITQPLKLTTAAQLVRGISMLYNSVSGYVEMVYSYQSSSRDSSVPYYRRYTMSSSSLSTELRTTAASTVGTHFYDVVIVLNNTRFPVIMATQVQASGTCHLRSWYTTTRTSFTAVNVTALSDIAAFVKPFANTQMFFVPPFGNVSSGRIVIYFLSSKTYGTNRNLFGFYSDNNGVSFSYIQQMEQSGTTNHFDAAFNEGEIHVYQAGQDNLGNTFSAYAVYDPSSPTYYTGDRFTRLESGIRTPVIFTDAAVTQTQPLVAYSEGTGIRVIVDWTPPAYITVKKVNLTERLFAQDYGFSKKATMFRRFDDSIAINEDLALGARKLLKFTESVSFVEKLIKQQGLLRKETVSLSDTSRKMVGLRKVESIGVGEGPTRDSIGKRLTDSVTFFEDLEVLGALVQTLRLLDSLAVSDKPLSKRGAKRLVESVLLSESATEQTRLTVGKDIVSIVDSLTAKTGKAVKLNEIVRVTDTIRKRVEILEQDSVSSTDRVTRKVYVRRLNDTLSILDSVVAGALRKVTVKDTVRPTDKALTKKVFNKITLNDVVQVTDILSFYLPNEYSDFIKMVINIHGENVHIGVSTIG